jgi:hypothetical protein
MNFNGEDMGINSKSAIGQSIPINVPDPEYVPIPMIKLKSYNKRAFLNMDGYSGCAYISIQSSKYEYECNYTIDIADCREKVRLHNDLITDEDRSNALYKLNVLIQELMAFKVHLIEEFNNNNLKY